MATTTSRRYNKNQQKACVHRKNTPLLYSKLHVHTFPHCMFKWDCMTMTFDQLPHQMPYTGYWSFVLQDVQVCSAEDVAEAFECVTPV